MREAGRLGLRECPDTVVPELGRVRHTYCCHHQPLCRLLEPAFVVQAVFLWLLHRNGKIRFVVSLLRCFAVLMAILHFVFRYFVCCCRPAALVPGCPDCLVVGLKTVGLVDCPERFVHFAQIGKSLVAHCSLAVLHYFRRCRLIVADFVVAAVFSDNPD